MQPVAGSWKKRSYTGRVPMSKVRDLTVFLNLKYYSINSKARRWPVTQTEAGFPPRKIV